MTKEESLKVDLATKIIAFYSRNGFGKVFKAEIDTQVFHYYLLKELDDEYVNEKGIRYFSIDKSQIYKLSMSLGISEARIKKLIEEDYHSYKNFSDNTDFMLDILKNRNLKSGEIKSGKVKLYLPNYLTKRYFEEKVFRVKGIPEQGTNPDVMIIELYDFIKILKVDQAGEVEEIVKAMILENVKNDISDKDIKDFIKRVNKEPTEVIIKEIAKGISSKFIGKASDTLFDEIFNRILKK